MLASTLLFFLGVFTLVTKGRDQSKFYIVIGEEELPGP
jgi:hypothetical protein